MKMIHPLLHLDSVFEKQDFKVDLLLWKGSYRAIGCMRIAIQKVFLGFRSFHCGVNSGDSWISAGLMIRTQVAFSCHCWFGRVRPVT